MVSLVLHRFVVGTVIFALCSCSFNCIRPLICCRQYSIRLLWFGGVLSPTLCLQIGHRLGFDVVSAVLFLLFGVSCLLARFGQPFLVCYQHLWFGLSFFATGICDLFFLSFFATGICGLVFLSLSQVFVVCSFFLCHRHLWFGLSCFVTGICGLFFLSLPRAFVVWSFTLSSPQAFAVWSFFLCHRHLWSVFLFFATGICVQFLSFTAFSAAGIRVTFCLCLVNTCFRVSGYLSIVGIMLCSCCSLIGTVMLFFYVSPFIQEAERQGAYWYKYTIHIQKYSFLRFGYFLIGVVNFARGVVYIYLCHNCYFASWHALFSPRYPWCSENW